MPPRPSGPEGASTLEKLRESFPSPEDWVALQGGKPRVFRNPRRPNARWLVVHVYEEHDDAKKRFQSGAVVDTLPTAEHFQLLNLTLPRPSGEGMIRRNITVPSFMNRHVHGDLCEQRSGELGGDSYKHIKSQPEYERYIDGLTRQGLEEVRFGITNEGFSLQPLPAIRSPRPLAA